MVVMKPINIAIDRLGLSGIGGLYTPPISAQAVHKWAAGDVPEERCPAIERAMGGEVVCEAMRPDVAWVRIPDANWPHPKGRPLVDHSPQSAPNINSAVTV